MDWMISYDRLDDDQKEFVDVKVFEEGNLWIKGFAGSGKSVLLVHALRIIRKKEPNAKIAFIVYTRSLLDLFKSGLEDLGLGDIPVMTFYSFRNSDNHYDYIFCDEVQDIPVEDLDKMRKRSRHIHVAGDSNQSIYAHGSSPSDISASIQAKPFTLKKIYRLTTSLIRVVQSLLPQMDIFGARIDITKKDVKVKVKTETSYYKEVEYVINDANDFARNGKSTVILLPTQYDIISFCNYSLEQNGNSKWQKILNQYGKTNFGMLNNHLKHNKVNLQIIGNGYGSLKDAYANNNIILMTYHSSKGLDFDSVYIPFLSDDLNIPSDDQATLLMVAITRSRMNVTITYSGFPHSLLKRFLKDTFEIKGNNNKNIIDDDLDI